jgi:hypothetical protein
LRLGAFEIPYGEAWLLEAAVKYRIPLAFLAMTDDEMARMLNHPSHHMTRDELLRTLGSLFMRGELVGSQEVLGDHVPTAQQIRTALAPPVRLPNGGISWGSGEDAPLFYGLSPAGAARWERMAEPEWERYFELASAEDDTWELVAGSQQRLDELLNSTKPPEGVIERDILRPWEATYWKTLPSGYRVRIGYQSAGWWSPGEGRSMPDQILLRRWHRSIWDPPD